MSASAKHYSNRLGLYIGLSVFIVMAGCTHPPVQTESPAESSSMAMAITAGPELYRPRFPGSKSSTVDVDNAASVTISFLYKPMQLGDTVGMRWKGSSEWYAPIQRVKKLDEPLMFTIPRSEIIKDSGRTAVITGSVGVGDNPLVISPPFNVRVTQTGVEPGTRVANNLNARYNAREHSCPGNLPAYYCNGIIIRSVDNGNFNPWDPSPSAIKLGALSFSYFRVDSHVGNFYRNAGFIFLPQSEAVKQGKGMNYLCIYAYDAGTIVGTRSNKGCGLKSSLLADADLSTCASKNATTVATWYAFTRTVRNRDYQCSLSTQNAAQFAVSYQVRANRPANMEALWNELMVGLWPQNHGTKLPIEAFFFKAGNSTSLNDAKTFQRKFKSVTGIWVPVVSLNLSRLSGSPFSYNKNDQAVQP